MRKIILSTVIAISTLSANFYDIKPISITKDIHCVIGDFNTVTAKNKGFVSNMCFIDIGNSIVVLDAGPTYNFAKEFYTIIKDKYSTKKVSHVIISNFHDDRLLGASFFKEIGIKIVGHKTINDDVKQYKSKFGRIENLVSEDIYRNTKIVKVDTLVDGGYKIIGSKKTLEILKPSKVSEEKSDIAIYSKDDSFLFVGNIVFNGRMLNYRKASNVDGWIEAIENLSKINAKYLLGGHGKEYDRDSYKASLEYLKILKKDVQNGFDNDLDALDIKENMKAGMYKNIPFYNQLNSSNINNYYYQLEWAE